MRRVWLIRGALLLWLLPAVRRVLRARRRGLHRRLRLPRHGLLRQVADAQAARTLGVRAAFLRGLVFSWSEA